MIIIPFRVMRMQAIKAVQGGQSATEVAKAYGINRQTIYRWMANCLSGGQKVLLAKPIPGHPHPQNYQINR